MTSNRILVIDDDPDITAFIKDVAEEVGYDVATAQNNEQVKSACDAFEPSVIVLDLMMPDVDGVEVLRMLADNKCRAEILLISGMDEKVLHTARRLGRNHGLDMGAVLQKPIDLETLEKSLEDAKTGGVDAISEQDLERGIAEQEIVVFYQPSVDLRRENLAPIDSFEALARWRHKEHGLLPPGAFVPLAETCGAIRPMTESVLDSVLAQLAAWKNVGFDASVAVNFAPQLLVDLDFPDQLAAKLEAHGIAPSQLVLEVTESGAMADAGRTMDILTRLRLKEVRVSMDDFGTGYSSLVQLHRMPFTQLKIDKSFVMDLARDDEAKAIVRTIIDLARNLGLEVCAEGVEDEDALDLLRSWGAEKAQGYWVSKPIPADEAFAFVNKWGERKI